MEREIVVTRRECPARLVPSGTKIKIPKDTFLTITQSLGGNYTVTVSGNMARIDGTDAEAIGKEALDLDFKPLTDGRIDEGQIWTALESIYDPEIPVSLVQLGLIYSLSVDQPTNTVKITMTLTAPGCGMGPVLVDDVKYRVGKASNVKLVEVELVFDPPWSREMISEEAQLETGLFF